MALSSLLLRCRVSPSLVLAAAAATALPACGGHGDAPAVGASPQGASAQITAANYRSVVTAATAATRQVSDMPDKDAPGTAKLASAQPRALLGGVTTSNTADCPGGGRSTVQVVDGNGNARYDLGDSYTIDESDCVADGWTYQGRVSYTANASTVGDAASTPYQSDFTVSYQGYTVSAAAFRLQADGQVRIQVDRPAAGPGTDTYSTASLTESYVTDGQTESVVLTDFKEVDTYLATEVSVRYEGLIATAALAHQSVAISTPEPLQIRVGEAHPYHGRVVYRGTGGSQVSLTALNNAQVRIDFDRDGDGVAEESSVQAWADVE